MKCETDQEKRDKQAQKERDAVAKEIADRERKSEEAYRKAEEEAKKRKTT